MVFGTSERIEWLRAARAGSGGLRAMGSNTTVHNHCYICSLDFVSFRLLEGCRLSHFAGSPLRSFLILLRPKVFSYLGNYVLDVGVSCGTQNSMDGGRKMKNIKVSFIVLCRLVGAAASEYG